MTTEYYNFLKSHRYDEILSYDSNELEYYHDFIQWIFPTTTPSLFNSNAPVINIVELRSSPHYEEARVKIIDSLKLILKHWGIELKENELIIYDETKFRLLNGHNGLRFSRVLQSLVYHEYTNLSQALLEFILNNVSLLKPKRKNEKTIWEIRLQEAIDECNF